MASEVSICNQALSWLGGNLIISLDDQITEAQLCKANYAELRDAVLEEGEWTFATKRFKLLPSPDAPVYGYSHKFEIPNEVMVVKKATNYKGNANDSNEFDWRREGDYILANVDVVYIKAIVRITDVKKFNATFNQALAARIAADIAVPLTESSTKEDRMWNKYLIAMSLALPVDGMQGKSDKLRSNSGIVRRR